MRVGVAYTEPQQGVWLDVDVPENATVREAIEISGILKKFPHIDLATQKVGVFGRFSKLEALLKEGDRVEIYRQITADPNTVQRKEK
jgi:putative ubiquitin-RnfH superfamily antitoxin RatB of RatAB toxin-antitoxin module